MNSIGTVVTYYAIAIDNNGARTEGSSDTYTVLPNENIPPSVGAPVRVPSGPINAITSVDVYSLINDVDGTISSDSLYIDLSGAGYNPVAHDSIDAGGNYWFHIGLHSNGTVVTYYAVATDNNGARVVGSSDTYTVANSLPVVGTPARLPAGKLYYDANVIVNATITDLDGTIATEMLQLQLSGGGYNPVARDSLVGTTYWYTIGPRAAGTVVDYYITATDNDGGTSNSSTFTYTVHGTVPISLIQYSSGPGANNNCYPSDSIRTNQQVTGVVLATFNGSSSARKRAFVQDSQNPLSGIYIYGLPQEVRRGDNITVRDSVAEYFWETEMMPPTRLFTLNSSGNPLPTPTVLTCAQFPADSCNAIAEPYEDMFIQINNLTIDSLNTGRAGNFWAHDGSGSSSIVSNDLAYGLSNPDSVVAFSVGQVYDWVRGVARYAYGRYRIAPQSKFDMQLAIPNAPPAITNVAHVPGPGVLPTDDVNVNATITDSDGTIAADSLYLQINGGGYVAIEKSGVVGDVYTYHIGTNIIGTIVDYYVMAKDNDGARTESIVYSYTVAAQTECTATLSIFDVQNSFDPGADTLQCWNSPYAGQFVTVCGIVSAVQQGATPRFYLQDPANGTSWGNIYSYKFAIGPNSVNPTLRDHVQITARPVEIQWMDRNRFYSKLHSSWWRIPFRYFRSHSKRICGWLRLFHRTA